MQLDQTNFPLLFQISFGKQRSSLKHEESFIFQNVLDAANQLPHKEWKSKNHNISDSTVWSDRNGEKRF
jgi:hypothetical protein